MPLSLHAQALLVQFSNASFECGELHGVEGSEAAGWRERYRRMADVRERLEAYIGELEAGKVEGGVGASDLAADRERDAGKLSMDERLRWEILEWQWSRMLL